MTQPTERRFVMEPRLDAEVAAINDVLATKIDDADYRLSDERIPVDNSVTSAKIVDGTIVNADIANTTIESAKLAAQDYIKFDTTYATGSTQAGELAWDQDNETLEFMLDDHVTLQIGQEHVMRVKNNSGSVAIPERTVVMFAGAAGDTIKVAPAVSDGSINVNYLAGITTEEIPADGFGFVTQLGFINQVNTNGWAIGTLLYSDPATPGGLTSTEPEAPAWTMPVAAVTKQNASAGRILVRAIPGGSGAGGGAAVNISATVPAGGNPGDMWYDSNDGTLYVYYEDVDGSQWVQVQANSALDASIVSRVGALEAQSIAYGNPNPNVIINGGMDVWQRGTSFAPVTNGGYTADRWQAISSVAPSSRTVLRNALAGEISGLEDVSYYLRSSINTIGSGTNPRMRYYVENVATLAGKVVTLSWYGRNNVAGSYRTLLSQGFGTGGSTAVTAFDTNVAYTTSWQRLSVTFTMPSIAGKTIGDGSYLLLDFFQAATTGNLLDITGVQLEAGSVATAFRRNAPSLQAELAACQRYFYSNGGSNAAYNIFNSGNCQTSSWWFPTEMRIIPTVTVWDGAGTINKVSIANAGGSSQNAITPPATMGVTKQNFQYIAGGLGGTTGNNGVMMLSAFTASAEF